MEERKREGRKGEGRRKKKREGEKGGRQTRRQGGKGKGAAADYSEARFRYVSYRTVPSDFRPFQGTRPLQPPSYWPDRAATPRKYHTHPLPR